MLAASDVGWVGRPHAHARARSRCAVVPCPMRLPIPPARFALTAPVSCVARRPGCGAKSRVKRRQRRLD
eukprot:6428060-Prymnesium_polylepis.1